MRQFNQVTSLFLFLAALGCGGSGNDEDQVTPDAQVRGDVAKGDMCSQDSDCAEVDAKCRAGDVCTGSLGENAFMRSCFGEPENCPGLSCLGLRNNVQGKEDICTMRCATNEDCGRDAACVTFGADSVCLHICTRDSDCLNDYVCVESPEGIGSACLVMPL